MIEEIIPYIFLGGVALLIIGAIYLFFAAIRKRWWWGLAFLAFPPSALIFFWKHPRESLVPSLILFVGTLFTAGPPLYQYFTPVDLGPRLKVVGDEVHVTLTGWDRDDYSILSGKPETVVLQMANPDVSDATLAFLSGMSKLRELDLSGTKVSDQGLARLAESARNLEVLRLRGTSVTDSGIGDSLSQLGKLRQLDVRETKVSKEALQTWREAKPGRRAMQ